MDASEIEYLEARLAERGGSYPSPEQIERHIAKAHKERNRVLGAAFSEGLVRARHLFGEIRKIAVACTAARLHPGKG